MTESKIIREACERFLHTWSRRDWMSDNGEWVSEQWNDARDEVRAILGTVDVEALGIDDINLDPETMSNYDIDELEERMRQSTDLDRDAIERLLGAAEKLRDQVHPGPDGRDYIEPGLLDPDGVANDATPLDIGDTWEGWDCREGWQAHRCGDALYICWTRDAWGQRHERELWVLVHCDIAALVSQ